MNNMVKLLIEIAKSLTSISSILGLIGAMLCYKFATKDMWWVIMTYLLVLLVCKVSMWSKHKYVNWKGHKETIRYYENEQERRNNLAKARELGGAKSFFLTLSDERFNKLMAIYNYHDSSTVQTHERIIPFGNMLDSYAVELIENESFKLSHEIKFVDCKNQGFYGNGEPILIWFHPYLYALMDNYAKTGIKDYPLNYNS